MVLDEPAVHLDHYVIRSIEGDGMKGGYPLCWTTTPYMLCFDLFPLAAKTISR